MEDKHDVEDTYGSGPTGFMDNLRIGNTPPVQPEPSSLTRPNDQTDPTLDSGVQNDTAGEEPRENDGGMAFEARRALVFLLRQGVILSSQKPKLFEAIGRYEDAIRRHLSDVYLKLVMDEKAGVAFVAGVQSEYGRECDEDEDDESEPVSLISRRMLPLYDTLLLLVLRKHYQHRELCGEQKIIIDADRIESDLSPFLPLTNSSRSDKKKLNGALKNMVKRKILSTVRGSQDRFEITPVIRYVVSAEFLESMLEEYQRLANEQGAESRDIPGTVASYNETYPRDINPGPQEPRP